MTMSGRLRELTSAHPAFNNPNIDELSDAFRPTKLSEREFTVQLTNSTLALPNSKPQNRDIPMGYKKQLQEIKKNFGVFLRNDVKESYRKKHNSIEGGDNTKKYIDACVELCWLMVIQDPPVVIETPASKDSALDTNTYRAYTTTGPKVDFVVWPALRLHHGGPLLTKGVAQGKK
ncbi:hypothetical protein ACJMK2_031585 [Sinanodonta woodiana]|uniref:Mitochondria-eating protein C-terminal domain-containing protein n=1 Tax=Sinanodonta woodiana TaxID=1069815 RepID=A0ABD3X371_SINWO